MALQAVQDQIYFQYNVGIQHMTDEIIKKILSYTNSISDILMKLKSINNNMSFSKKKGNLNLNKTTSFGRLISVSYEISNSEKKADVLKLLVQLYFKISSLGQFLEDSSSFDSKMVIFEVNKNNNLLQEYIIEDESMNDISNIEKFIEQFGLEIDNVNKQIKMKRSNDNKNNIFKPGYVGVQDEGLMDTEIQKKQDFIFNGFLKQIFNIFGDYNAIEGESGINKSFTIKKSYLEQGKDALQKPGNHFSAANLFSRNNIRLKHYETENKVNEYQDIQKFRLAELLQVYLEQNRLGPNETNPKNTDVYSRFGDTYKKTQVKYNDNNARIVNDIDSLIADGFGLILTIKSFLENFKQNTGKTIKNWIGATLTKIDNVIKQTADDKIKESLKK